MRDFSGKEYLILHLSLVDGVGPSTIKKLIDKKPDAISWKEYYNFSVQDIIHLFAISEKIAQKVVSGLQDSKILDVELALIKKHNVQVITVLDETYPSLLQHIHQPPAVLYVYGAPIHDDEKRIAVIGSRSVNLYGERSITSLVPSLVANDWVIVSGGAIGADTMAHKAALDAGGKTIIVLGSGLLRPYPASNKRLFNRAKEAGSTIVSPFPLQMAAFPGHFPSRNRIIAGLSQGCLVVQGAEKSGTRITAQFALDQGREVFAIPGPIDDPLSLGCHKLIQDGAKLVSTVDDILVEFGQESIKKDIPDVFAARENLTEVQQSILQACKSPISVDELALVTQLDPSQLHQELFNLQLEGNVSQDFTGKWAVI